MERKGFIGGSDCVKILQGEWLELWQVKTGRAEPADLSRNIAVQLGIHTEDFNLSWFEQEHALSVTDQQKAFSTTIGDVPVKGTIDGLVGNDIIEAKHTNAFSNMDEVIKRYMPQIQLYARLANAEGAYLSVIFGNSKWESSYVARCDRYFDTLWAVVSDFWGYVCGDREPLGINPPFIEIESIPVDNMVVRNAQHDNEFISRAHDYIEHEAAARSFENAKKDLKNMVGANEREVYCDLLSIKRDKRGSLRITPRRNDK